MKLLEWVKQQLSGEPVSRRFGSLEDVERNVGMHNIFSQVYPMIDELDEPEEGMWYFLQDIYFDAGILYAIIAQGGKLYRSDVRVGNDDSVSLGTLLPITTLFVPVVSRTGEQQQQFQTTKVMRTADGRYRWLSISNTAILNRVGELDSRALFDSFVEHAQRTGEYPYRTFNHENEVLRTGQADFLARDGYTYITSGLYDEGNPLAEIERAAFVAHPELWGESIGFGATAPAEIMRTSDDGISIPVYTQGVHIEISTCLERSAAAWFTAPLLIRNATEAKKRMQNSTLRAIQQLIGDAGVEGDAATALLSHFEASVDAVNQRAMDGTTISRTADGKSGLGDAVDAIIKDAGTDSSVARAGAIADEAEVTEEAAEETAVSTEPVAAGEIVVDESVIDAVVSRMLASEQLAAVLRTGEGNILERIAADVQALTERFNELEETANGNFQTVAHDLSAVQAQVSAEVERAADMPVSPASNVVFRPSIHRAGGVQAEVGEEPAGLSKIPHLPGTR